MNPDFPQPKRESYRLDTSNRPETCNRAGHVRGCAGAAGGDHELVEGWIAIEQPDGTVIEVEVAA